MAVENPPQAPEANPPPTPAPLPEGYIRLSEAAGRRADDPYAPLRPYVGKDVVMTSLTVSEDGKKGQMGFVPLDDQEAAEVAAPVPSGALRAVVRAVQAHPEARIVFSVKQLKRGIALQ